MKNLYLIEFYTNNLTTGESGWDINFAWVHADTRNRAFEKLKLSQGARFDCVITCEEHTSIAPLAGNFRVNTPDANLFILS